MVLIKWQIEFLNANKIVLDTFVKLFVQKYYFEAKKTKTFEINFYQRPLSQCNRHLRVFHNLNGREKNNMKDR